MSVDTMNIVKTDDFFRQCCTSERWVQRMVKMQPYASRQQLMEAAEENWHGLSEEDYLQAFAGHPKIGDVNSLQEKYRNTAGLASAEQSAVGSASDEALHELARLNNEYEQRFGFIFIVCATGKSAQEMLELLKKRIVNQRQRELRNAAAEQLKITLLRLNKQL